MKNIINIKKDFPIFYNYKDLIYLDSAATSQKPKQVIKSVTDFYEKYNSNIHRGIYKLAEKATELYEDSRKKIGEFIGVNDASEIIFTGNTNESINLVAVGWGKKFLKKGDIVVLSNMEHHANIVPWQRLKNEIGISLHFLPITDNYRLDYKSLIKEKIDFKKIKLVSLIHASNVLGTINPIKEIISFFKQKGIYAKFLIDAAQSVPHFTVDVKDLDCDFLAFSSHKMLGPSGVGVLWVKKEILATMDPLFVGSQMINKVTKEKTIFADLPMRFEVGTGKLEGVFGLGVAIEYLKNIGMNNISTHEKKLTEYALKSISSVSDIKIYGPKNIENRLGIFSFSVKNIHPHDVAQILDNFNICVRSGHQCAQILMDVLNVGALSRASIYLYNTKKDIDELIKGLEQVKEKLK